MPHRDTAHDELLAIRRQEQDLAQARHALTRRQVRDQEKLLVALRQSRLAAVARLEWAEGHRVTHLDAEDMLARIDTGVANARRRLEWLRAQQQEEQRDLAAASQRLELAEINRERRVARIDRLERHGYAIEEREDVGARRKAA
jgi:hypothetical protein